MAIRIGVGLILLLGQILAPVHCMVVNPPAATSPSAEQHPLVPGILMHVNPPVLQDNLTSSSSASQEASVEEEVVVKKPAAVKFSNADGKPDDAEESPEEFRDKQQRILRREHETQEEMLRQAEEQKKLRKSCFHVPEEYCEYNNFTADLSPDQIKNNLCPCKPHPATPNAIICCNVTNIHEAKTCYNRRFGRPGPGQIHIRNATIRELDMNDGWWKNFDKISVTDGRIDKLSNSFNQMTRLTCLNVSNNNISSVDPRMFKSVQGFNFTVLDMTDNNITQVPNVLQFPNLTLNIRGNNWIICKVLHDAIVSGLNLAARNQSQCQTTHDLQWFNSSAQMAVSQLYLDKDLQMVCPKNCTCSLTRMNFDEQDASSVAVAVEVNCTSKGFLTLPERLPPNTVALNMSHNNITSLRHLSNHESLVRLILDNNEITNLLDMEGTTFKYDYMVLSLRNNKLKQIPTYILALDRNPLGKKVYLEGNKLTCDCKSATELRMWLYAHKKSLIDYDKIACENKEAVIYLQEEKWCQSQHDAFDYIFYLIAIEVLLLLALIMKVSYDYYVFKTQSYLPWPANKMPKLPCDWLCES